MRNSSMRACAFSGHRPHKLGLKYDETLPECVALKKKMEEQLDLLIEKHMVSRILVGLAMGCDLWMGEMVLERMRNNRELVLECAVPFVNQTEKWSAADRKRYLDRYLAITHSDRVELLYKPLEAYEKGAYHLRNSYMISKADYLLAVWNGRPSGTGSTIREARKLGKKCIIINPFEDYVCSDLEK